MRTHAGITWDEKKKGPANAMLADPFDVLVFSVSGVETAQVTIICTERNRLEGRPAGGNPMQRGV